MSASPSPDSANELHDLSCHSRQTSSADSTASIQSLHLASVPLSSFSTSRAPVSPPSSRSATSPHYRSPEASPNSDTTSYRVYRHDNNAVDGSNGSVLGTGEVVGLMRTINLTSSPTTSIIPERDLEEGEIRESQASPKSAIAIGRAPRQREQSFGGALPSSPEVLPSAASGRLSASLSPIDSGGTTSSVAINSFSNLPTASTLSSILSSSSFHTASSSSSIPTSISNSGSVNDLSMCNYGSQVSSSETRFVSLETKPISSPPRSQPISRSVKVPETGPIDLEALEKDSAKETHTLNLPSTVPAHILNSDIDTTPDESNDATGDQFKSPNVYINGLPPHFPEDQLFELAAPFGEIRSVRSFTRHVGEKESGYGFVLFETVDAAEKCIQSLRRFRNLHPTFSKQSHKIPGMPYTQSTFQSGWTYENDNGPSLAHGAGGHSFGAGSKNQTGESFKAKMERFQDPNSTNLYIEGLPLSIDEPSLIALVSPHRIKSSRLFQTRLSNPPRIIAFVRLETRQGAEEVVERLHGRMVRGWNDPGSRISVRFADTSEQRELRRAERAIREDDVASPARLTIAQAALLNLRGRDQLRNQQHQQTGINAPLIGAGRSVHGSAPTVNQVYNDFSCNAHDLSSATAGGYRGSASDLTSAAQLLAGLNNGPRRVSPYHQASPLPNVLGQTNQDLTPAMAALLDSLRGNGTPWTGHDNRYTAPQRQLPTLRNAHPILGDVDLNLAFAPQYQNRIGGGVAQTRSGYTPAEELILNAHAQRRKGGHDGGDQTLYRQHDQHGDEADLNVGVRGYRTQASTMAVQQQTSSYYPPSGNLPVVVESDGDHETESQHQPTRYPQSQLNGRVRVGVQVRNTGMRERDIYTNNLISNNPNQQAHVRSTTLPPSSTPSTIAPRHYQHSSMSIPKSRNIANDIMRTTSSQLQTISSNQPQAPLSNSKHRSTNSISSSINNDSKSHDSNNHSKSHLYSDASDIRIQDGGSSYTDLTSANQPQHHYRHTYSNKIGNDHEPSFSNNNIESKKNNFDDGTCGITTHPFSRNSEVYEVHQTSPPLVSPALTYSSRGSGATLSPSTPYVGSFSAASGNEPGGDFQPAQRVETEVGAGEQ